MAAVIRIHRGLLATIAVAATAGAVYFGERPGDDSRSVGQASAAAPDASRTDSGAKSASLAELVGLPRAGLSREIRGDLFAVPARPAPAVQSAAPLIASAPVVPPFPYKYGGWVAVGVNAQRVHYLHRGNEVIAIGRGDVLDGAWRVDTLSDERIEVSYVPLGQQRSMLLASLMGETGAQGTAAQGAVAPAAVASAGQAPGRTLSSEPVAPPAAAQPAAAASTVIAGAIPFPSTARTASAGVSAGPDASSPVPTGKLGADAPTSGSMPTGPAQGGSSMPIGRAPAGTMPTGPTPTGKLGL
jgi:hypothetical protein